MTGKLRWHSCSTDDFPLKRHKVSKACEACRGKKMRCDGLNPCQRCESNKIKCIYRDRPVRSRSSNDTTTSRNIPTTTTTTITKTNKKKKNLCISTSKELMTSPISSTPSSISSTSSFPSPIPSHNTTKSSNTLDITHLKKITFVNELYETLRLKQSQKTRRYGTPISPLLLDFFNTTSQPQTIWTCFIICLNKFCDSQPIPNNPYFMRDAPEIESNELVKETFRLFVTHNLLYGSFIDTQLLLYVLDSVSMFSYMQQSNNESSAVSSPITTVAMETKGDNASLPYYSIVIYCILAITFQSAYQSLPNMNENFTNNLYIYSHVFYREAHKRFLAICFPSIPADNIVNKKEEETKRNMILLVQASVLLTHFQCTAISEEQAFMTIKMGLSLVEQYSLTETTIEDQDEKESLLVLLKSLDAWYVWLAFYLQKPYNSIELDITHITSNNDEELFQKKNKDQIWAIHITDTFTCFLKSLLESKRLNQAIDMDTIKSSLKYLHDIVHDDSNDDNEDFTPNSIISLYHDILTIQLYTCQLDNHLLSISNNTLMLSTSNEQQSFMDNVFEICTESCQNILTTVNKVIFLEYNNTNATAPLKFIPLSIIYSICIVSQINLYFINHKITGRDIDYLYLNLDKMLKIASPYFEAFQILYSKFNTNQKLKSGIISPSPSSSSTTTTHSTTNKNTTKVTLNNNNNAVSFVPENQPFLSSIHNNGNHGNELFLTESQQQQQHMNLPVTGGIVRSRADIDREQLEKLSHNNNNKNPASYNQQQLQFQQQQQLLFQKQQQLNNQFQFQQQQQQQQSPNNTATSNYYLQKYMQQPSPIATTGKRVNNNNNGFNSQQQSVNSMNEQLYYYSNNNKRTYQQLYNQLDYNNITPQSSSFPLSKRHRSSTSASFDEFTSKSNHHNSMLVQPDEQQHQHERSKSIATAAAASTTTDFIDLESNNDTTFMYNMWMLEGATPEELYDARQQQHNSKPTGFNHNNNAYLQQQQQDNNNLTKLPLPQPSKQTSMIPKNWSAPAPTQTWSKFFFESEVQTLHYQTPPLIHFESNPSFPMVGLNVIQEETNATGATSANEAALMYPPSHRASIISDHSSTSNNSSVIAPTATNNVTSSQTSNNNDEASIEAEAAVAAAAAAVWASTAAAVAANAAFSSNAGASNKNVATNTSYHQGAATNNSNTNSNTTGHWINSEKVDDEFWTAE